MAGEVTSGILCQPNDDCFTECFYNSICTIRIRGSENTHFQQILSVLSPTQVEWGALKGPPNAAKKEDQEFDAPDEEEIDGIVPELSRRQQDGCSEVNQTGKVLFASMIQ